MNCYSCGIINSWPSDGEIWLSDAHMMPYAWVKSNDYSQQAIVSDSQLGTDYLFCSGIAILCNLCWLSLWTPEKRWPFYEQWCRNNEIPTSTQFAVEQNCYEDYTYDEKLLLAVGSIVECKRSSSSFKAGYVDNISNHTISVSYNTKGRMIDNVTKSEFDTYYRRTGMDQRLYEQACRRDEIRRRLSDTENGYGIHLRLP